MAKVNAGVTVAPVLDEFAFSYSGVWCNASPPTCPVVHGSPPTTADGELWHSPIPKSKSIIAKSVAKIHRA
jgi:hypothetical protein